MVSLKTNFCDLKLLKSSEGDTFTFSGHAPTFVAHIMQGTYASVEDACAVVCVCVCVCMPIRLFFFKEKYIL